jgi:hypothetical protein
MDLKNKRDKMVGINRETLRGHRVQTPRITQAENGKASPPRDRHEPLYGPTNSQNGDKSASKTDSMELTVSTILMYNVMVQGDFHV